MTLYGNVTTVASLIGDATRTAILMALLGGQALPAGELAKLARVSPQTASNHLAKLVAGGLLTMEAWGRHRYYRLASPDVAKALESISSLSPPTPVRSLRQSTEANALCFARTCYDHIAGRFGVAFTDALLNKGYLAQREDGYIVRPLGAKWFETFGIAEKVVEKHGASVPRHVDWTERVHHMAGPIALAVTKRLLELDWIRRGPVRRSIVVTTMGREKLAQELGLNVDDER
jgi:DNA-binding transcriptional ArsR family regulator